ncbi:hypothetical protein BDF19DRAFT_477558 [Syncephalis fuscata]|nr:hypothetical protein BDF19DRAFT_477558 [Syncephalis fuscata]
MCFALSMNRFASLPYDILCRIALAARPADVMQLAATSRELFFRLACDETFWRILLHYHFPSSPLEDEWALWCLFEPMKDSSTLYFKHSSGQSDQVGVDLDALHTFSRRYCLDQHWRHGRYRVVDILYADPAQESRRIGCSTSNGSSQTVSIRDEGGSHRSHLAMIQQTTGYTLLYDFARRQLLMMTHRIPKQQGPNDVTVSRTFPEIMNLPKGLIPYPYATDARLNAFFIALRCQRVVEMTVHLVLYQRASLTHFYSRILPVDSKLCELRATNWSLYDLMVNDEPNVWNWCHTQSHCHLQISRTWPRKLNNSPSEKVALVPSKNATNISTEIISKLNHLAIFRVYRANPECALIKWELLRLRAGHLETKLRSGEFQPENATGFRRKLKSIWLGNQNVLLQSGASGSKVNWLALLSLSQARLVWEYSNPGELVLNFAEYGFLAQGMNARQVQSVPFETPPAASTARATSIVELRLISITNGTVLRRFSCHWCYHPIRIIGTLCLIGTVNPDGQHNSNCVVDLASGRILCVLDVPRNSIGAIKTTVVTGCVGFNDSGCMRLFSFDYQD